MGSRIDFDHGTGHGVGAYLCVHEGPQRIAKRGSVALEVGILYYKRAGYYVSKYGIHRKSGDGGEWQRQHAGFRNVNAGAVTSIRV